ncbi:MAG: hypothetical protein QM482_07270 [Sulfurospirillum sp.]
MVNKIVAVLLILCMALSANMVRVRAAEQAPTKQEAIQNAYWVVFEQALDKIMGASSYVGNVKESFKADMDKDFVEFQKTYFRSPRTKCNNLGEDGYECLVLANLNLEQIKAIVAEKSNSSTTMGRDSVENLDIVLVDEVDNDLSRDFITNLQGSINDSGNSLRVVKKGTQVGARGNKCASIERQYKKYKAKGSAYKSALMAIKEKLQECKNNKSVNYLFKLTNLKFHLTGKDSYGNLNGSLIYRMNMLNTQTGRVDNAIRSKDIESFGATKDQLKFKLYRKAADIASREITNNILRSIRKKTRVKKVSKIKKYKYFYTIIISGVTYDSKNRNKIKIVKDVIKKLGARPKRNSAESKDFEQVYNFGTNSEIDTDDLVFDLYDMADAIGFKIQAKDKGNNIIVVRFQ